MDDKASTEPKRISHSCVGCTAIVAVLIIAAFILYALPNISRNMGRARVENAAGEIAKTPPAKSLSNEDAEVLIVWMYLEVKLGKYCDEYAATEDARTADDSADRDTVIKRLTNLVVIAHTLPTNAKYKPLTDAIKASLHQRIDLIGKGQGLQQMDEATISDNLEYTKKFAADIRYATETVPQSERDRVLNRYYGSI